MNQSDENTFPPFGPQPWRKGASDIGRRVANGSRTGFAQIHGRSNIDYTPFPHASGFDEIEFKVIDSEGSSSIGKISFQITPVNDTPRITPSYMTIYIHEDTPSNVQMPISNVFDPDVDDEINPDSLMYTLINLIDRPNKLGNVSNFNDTNGTFDYALVWPERA